MTTDRRSQFNEHDPLKEQLKTKNRDRRESLARVARPGSAARRVRNDVLPRLELVVMPVDDLRTGPRKVRKKDPAHMCEVAASISELGFCDPVLVGKDNIVLDGEIRVDAARLIGLVTVPAIRIDHLSPDEQRLLRLALNRLGEKGQWDLAELKIEFEELVVSDAPIEISGFDLDEIDQIVMSDETVAEEKGPLEPPQCAAAVSRLGDMFRLGDHVIVCGDATDPAVLERLMGEDKCRFIFTDEPYNVKIQNNVTRGSHREFAMASGEMTDSQFFEFNNSWIGAAVPYLTDGGVFGTFIDWRGYPTVHAAATTLGLTALNLVVWNKTNAGMGSLYRSQHELLPLFKKGNAPYVNNVALGRRGRWRSNSWSYPGASSIGSDARRCLQDHPTVKPTVMLEDAILDLTDRGEVVLDAFLGSGSTLIACEKTGRICRGVELDPLYVDVILRRYCEVTGHHGILNETGEAFPEVAARRLQEVDKAANAEF